MPSVPHGRPNHPVPAHSAESGPGRPAPQRGFAKRLTLHPREKLLLWLVAINVCTLPWLIGGMRLWSQIPSLVLGVAGLVVSVLPRRYTVDQTGGEGYRVSLWPKLLRFPLFWLGGALLVVVAIQALNPSWEYRTNGQVWWMRKIDYLAWLPTGISAPLARWNPWRMLMIYGAVFSVVCSIWVGFTRRRTLQYFFITVAANGLALTVFGILQRLAGNGKLFWFWESPNPVFFSSFVYKNHGASYLLLGLAVTCGLAGEYYLRGLRRLEKSNPSGVFAFFALCMAVAILLSQARGVTAGALGFLAVCITVFVVHQIRLPTGHRHPVVVVAILLLFGVFLKIGLASRATEEALTRLRAMVSDSDKSFETRLTVTKASLDMLGDHWLAGTGAGSYRFLFPVYQHRYPEILTLPGGRPIWWEHAHNDIVQFPIELGLAGTLLILGVFGWLASTLVKTRGWINPLGFCIILGLLALLASSWWDFPFQNPAILVGAGAILVATVAWTRAEGRSEGESVRR